MAPNYPHHSSVTCSFFQGLRQDSLAPLDVQSDGAETLVYYAHLLPSCLPTSSQCGAQVLLDLALCSPLQSILPALFPKYLEFRNIEQMLLFLTAQNLPLLRTLLSPFQHHSTPKCTHTIEFLSALPTSNIMITVSVALSGLFMGVHEAL